MSVLEDEYRKAYQLLNVPETATAATIKNAYRQLTKRWHPDLYMAGSAEGQQATEMMQRVNEAYRLIAYAPMRYYRRPAKPINTFRDAQPIDIEIPNEKPMRPDRFEYAVRFVCGALLGVFLAAGMWLRVELHRFNQLPVPTSLVALGIVLLSGFLSARYGDDFWYAVLGRGLGGRYW